MANKKYTENELINLVCELVKESPDINLTPVILSRVTDVPRHIWRNAESYPKLKEVIDRLNAPIIPDSIKNYHIISIASCLEMSNSKEEAIAIGERTDCLINTLYEKLEESRRVILQQEQELNANVDTISGPSENILKLLNNYMNEERTS